MLPRRSLEEVLTVIEISPNSSFLFVEGQFDVQFFRHQLQLMGRKAELLTSDYVDMPADRVLAYGSVGNKGRLLALGEEMAAQQHSLRTRVAVIVDRDLESLNPAPTTWDRTLRTDHVAVDHYSTVFQDVVQSLSLLEGERIDVAFIEDIQNVCAEMFKLRGWMEATACQTAAPNPDGSLVLEESRICLDVDSYFKRLSSKAGRNIPVDAYVVWARDRQAAMPHLLQDQSTIADFTNIVFSAVKIKFGSRRCKSEQEIMAWIRGGLAATSIDSRPLGAALRSYLRT